MKKISVLMGIYNCEATLAEAIRSIQNQTYENWELIICDDGSTDDSLRVAEEYAEKDSRIIVIKNEKNEGLNYTLNHCLEHATGDYIARMDGDDISLPYRFERQVEFLGNNREFDIVSSPMIYFDDNGEWGRETAIEYPTGGDIVAGTPICHAPVMMRKECMDKVGGYTVDKRLLQAEDVNLWIKLYAAGYRCYNINEPLYCMRNDQNAFRRRKYRNYINSTYARLDGCKKLGLGPKYYISSLKPMIAGLIPACIRVRIRHRQYKSTISNNAISFK